MNAKTSSDVLCRWVRLVREHAWPTIVLCFAVSLVALVLALTLLGIDSDTIELFSEDHPARRNHAAFVALFPDLENALLIVIDAESPETITDHVRATSQIAQTTLRSVLGQSELDTLLSEREHVNTSLQQIIDEQTEPWGVKVTVVEVKDVELPESMQRAMARQAEAERERRAKIINADGEFQASERLAEAGRIMSAVPATLQLRFLQTLTEVASERNSTIIFPVPIDLIQSFMGQIGQGNRGAPPAAASQPEAAPPPASSP